MFSRKKREMQQQKGKREMMLKAREKMGEGNKPD